MEALSGLTPGEMDRPGPEGQRSSSGHSLEANDQLRSLQRDATDLIIKGKEDHTPTERWWGAHLPFYGREPVGG